MARYLTLAMPIPKKPAKSAKPAKRPAKPKPATKQPAQTTQPEPTPEPSLADAAREPAPAPARDYGAAGPPFDADRRRRYLEAIIETGGRQKAAAAAAGVSYTTVWERRKVDPAFKKDSDEAMAAAMVTIEDEARRRAIQGTERTFFAKDGRVSRIETEYSDTILLRLLERMETGSWRQRQQIEQGQPGAFHTAAELDEAIKNRDVKLAEARAQIQAQEAREMNPDAKCPSCAEPMMHGANPCPKCGGTIDWSTSLKSEG